MIAKLYEGKSMSEWAKHYQVSRQRIHQRLKNTGSVHGRQTKGRPVGTTTKNSLDQKKSQFGVTTDYGFIRAATIAARKKRQQKLLDKQPNL
jgi:Zn-dependent peptidase ImmA (M78 family)